MRLHVAFLGLLLTLLSAFGALFFVFRESRLPYFHGADQEIGEFLGSFQKAHQPLVEINFTALYGGSGRFEILYRRFMLPPEAPAVSSPSRNARAPDLLTRLQDFDAQRACELNPVSLDGASPDPLTLSSRMDQKSAAFREYLATGIGLPEEFLTPPLLDRGGHSYAYLLVEKGPAALREKSWVASHLSYFKASELAELLKRYQIEDPVYSAIARLRESVLEEIVRGSALVLTPDYLLVRDQSRFGFSPLDYRVYDARDLRAALENGNYDLVPYSAGAFCLQTVGSLCWTYSSRHAMSYLHRYSVAALALLGGFFALVLGLYLRWLREKSREQRRQSLALQVLSHEFRTPVSALLLLLEQLERRRDGLDQAAQDLVTRASGEAFRLQRIIEVSKTYLEARERKIRFRAAEIPSVNQWFADFALEAEVEVAPLETDCGLVADPFWLRFVLSSLVQNALAHGARPVRLRLARGRGRLAIAVEDQGSCDFETLGEMASPFVKSARSAGMGLGLNIVKFVVEEWGSELRYSKAPTSFSLTVGETR